MLPFARISLLAALVAATLSVFAAPASAGGGAPLHFDQKYYVPGDTAVGHTTFTAGSVGLEGVRRGPYVAYLLGQNQWINAPRIPTGAIRLGELHLARVDHGFRASLSFVVPDVRSGGHVIGYCNDPCRVSQLGDLWGGGIMVYGSHEEARAAHVVERAERRISALHSHLQVVQRRNRELASIVRDVQIGREILVGRLQAQLDAARSAAEEPATPLGLIGWLLFAATALLWAGRSVARVRRRRPPPAPSIPTEERVAERSPRELEPVG